TINETPVTDIAVSSMTAPSEATQGDQVEVSTTIENLGNQDVNQDIAVSLVNQNSGATIDSRSISGLNAGTSQSLTLSWDTGGVVPGSYTLRVSHNFTDDNAGNDSRTSEIEIIDNQ
ncbi:CARDB domain-containing protein, partial [Aliifodinibius salipaludis]|uniref:CARDB domain-containing protein n=1 Tax=Fodinibius salipaludis TaxID=2032627 RepID=UPI001C3EA425